MKPMSREASHLVNAGRLAFHPTEADRARLLTALAGTATLSVGAAVAADAAQRSLSGIFSLVPAARLLALALPLAAVGAYGFHSWGEPPATMQVAPPVNRAPAVVKQSPAEPPVQMAEAEPEALIVVPPSEPSVSVTERSAPPISESSKRGVEIRQEVALLSKAQSALSRGKPQEALEALSEHARRFPRGVLTEEGAATLARTLCALGRRQEAERELTRMEKRNPSSAYLARAREACQSR
jgi:TolA-binding protein